MVEQFETRSKKVRGMARASLDLIEKMSVIAEEAQPITGRGVGYRTSDVRAVLAALSLTI